jgi:lysophospholipase L1-like esterase
LQELEPQARIVLCSVLPVHKDQMNRDIVIPVNTALEKMQMPPTVSWLDLYSKFVNEDGSQNTVLYNDEVHLNEAGYQVWYDSLIQLLENLTK